MVQATNKRIIDLCEGDIVSLGVFDAQDDPTIFAMVVEVDQWFDRTLNHEGNMTTWLNIRYDTGWMSSGCVRPRYTYCADVNSPEVLKEVKVYDSVMLVAVKAYGYYKKK